MVFESNSRSVREYMESVVHFLTIHRILAYDLVA
jgi:hypothetical protein